MKVSMDFTFDVKEERKDFVSSFGCHLGCLIVNY